MNAPCYPGSPLRRHEGAGRYLRGRGRGGRLGRAMIVVVGAIAELERSLIIERVRAGMRRAKLESRHMGRKPLNVDRQAVYPAPPLDKATLVTVAGFSVHIAVAPDPLPPLCLYCLSSLGDSSLRGICSPLTFVITNEVRDLLFLLLATLRVPHPFAVSLKGGNPFGAWSGGATPPPLPSSPSSCCNHQFPDLAP